MKISSVWSILAALLAAAYAVPAWRPYVVMVVSVLGAVTVICTALASLPGKLGQAFATFGHDLESLVALFPPQKAPDVPKVIITEPTEKLPAPTGVIPPGA